MARPTSKSPFAEALEGLIDDTRLYSRREWAKLLGIKEPAISQWLSEETIPRASNLNLIFVTVERASDAEKAPLEAFRRMAQRPATEVSPKNGRRMLPNVWAYMKRPIFDELSNKLAKLSPAEQERLLEERFPAEAGRRPGGAPADSVPVGAADTAPSLEPATAHAVTFPLIDVPGPEGASATSRLSSARELLAPPTAVPYLTRTFRLHADDRPDLPAGPPVEWEQVARVTTRLVISAAPGSGKTSFLHHIAHALKERTGWATRQWTGRVPAYVPMRHLPAVQTADELWDALGHAALAPIRDRLVLLFDGFDEVPLERRQGIARAIRGLQEGASPAGFVVTSRPTRDLDSLGRITRCAMEVPADSSLLALAYREASSALVGSERRWDEALFQVGSCFRERPDVFHAVRSPLLLAHAARWFVRTVPSACHDADLLESCLTFLLERWDQEKDVVRPHSRWVGTSGRALFQWLGALSYNALLQQASDFGRENVLGWLERSSESAPAEEDLRAACESTGLIEPCAADRYRFVHSTFQEYLAARYVVESSRDATDFLRHPPDKPWVSSVLRFACTITNDATPLLQLVLGWGEANRPGSMATLAGMVAQPINASRMVLEQSCDRVAGWLEDYFAAWGLATSDEETEVFPEPKWRLAARCTTAKRPAAPDASRHVLKTIKALHRARLSPVKEPLERRLSRSTNDVVRSVGESMGVEGYMQGRSFSRGETDLFSAEVCEI